MRICLFTPNFLPSIGGAERAADVVVRGLIARGHDAMVLCQKTGPMPDVPYPVRRYRRPPAQHLWPELLAWPVRRAHRVWKFDVILAFYGYPTGYAASQVCRRLGVKLVISARGGDMYHCFHGLKKPRVTKTIRAAYRRADRIVSVSGWITSRLQEVCGNALPPIDLVPNGIDLAAHDKTRDQARDQPPPDIDSLVGGQPYVLHLATLNPVKGHDLALQAVARLHEQFQSHKLKYVIVGDGQSMPTIQNQVKQLGLTDTVVLLGKRVGLEKAWLYDHATLMVTTSREEGMPNVVIESMASGLPIIASDIGPHRELIEGRNWGVLFKDGCADDLGDKLGQLLDADLAPMHQRALDLRNDYGIETMIDGFERACQAALSQKTR